MTPRTSFDSHLWSDSDSDPHQIDQDNQTIIHRRCLKCGRDFARDITQTEWLAAYVGAFRIEFLADDVTELWLTEECSGRILGEDAERRRTRRA
jgi:hypothetical protein